MLQRQYTGGLYEFSSFIISKRVLRKIHVDNLLSGFCIQTELKLFLLSG